MSSREYKTQATNGPPGSPSNSTGEQEAHARAHEGYTPNRNERPDDNPPTLVLDVPVLNVDELNLEVEDLRAHVSLRAELANLVKINVGVDVYLDKVKLDIKGLEAQALLKVRLDRVLATLERALEAIDNNPQILGEVAQDVGPAVGDVGQDVSRNARETERNVDGKPQLEDAEGQAGEAVQQTGDVSDRATDEAGRTTQRAVEEPGDVTEPVPDESNEIKGEEATATLAGLQIEEEYIDERGRIVGRARDESGNVIEEALDEEGEASDSGVPEEAEDREPEDDNDGEVDATDAARRKAEELGVKLSDLDGTGSGGRVLVKDVERAAK